ncbi:unnamed protein product [Ilex paraguariensis]|uniref:WAT1-related protein n=1 Tax=Ilex paraguariensis TaxID=185542 RepID=A0ABC8THK0_9AQUA
MAVRGTLTQYFFLLGLEYTSATFTCTFINMVPVNTFIMALPFGLEKPNMKSKKGRAKVLGTLVCVGGALLLTLYRAMPLTDLPVQTAIIHRTDHSTKRWALGSVVLIAGSLLWSSWFLIPISIL